MKQQDFEERLEDWKEYPSRSYAVQTGCGNLYVTALYNDDGKLIHVFIPRKSKVDCDLTFQDSLRREATFQTRRDISTAIDDLKGDAGHCCQKFNISLKGKMKQGKLAAFSCSDAVARVLRLELSNKEKSDAVSK